MDRSTGNMEESNLKVIKLVDSTNYLPWKFQIKVLLENIADFELLEEEKPENTEAGKLKNWNKADQAARKIIVTSVSEKVLLTIMSCGTLKEMLDRLKRCMDRRRINLCMYWSNVSLRLPLISLEVLLDMYQNWRTLPRR